MQSLVEEALSIYEELQMEPEVASTLLLLAVCMGHKGAFDKQKELVERSMSYGESSAALISLAKSHGLSAMRRRNAHYWRRPSNWRNANLEMIRGYAVRRSIIWRTPARRTVAGSKGGAEHGTHPIHKRTGLGEDDPRIRSALYSAARRTRAFGNAERQILVLGTGWLSTNESSAKEWSSCGGTDHIGRGLPQSRRGEGDC